MSDDPLLEGLVAMSRFLVSESTLGATLQRIADITDSAVDAADFVGISMLDEHGQAVTSVYTHQDSPDIDAAQYESGSGPCLDAWRERRIVRIDDMHRAHDRYPEFSRAALRHGVEATLSLPMVGGDEGVGAMNLYSRTPRTFGDDEERLGSELATAAAVVLKNASAYWRAYDLGENLAEAMSSRALIEQAKGMLMAQAPSLDADSAFDVLRHASQRENVKVRDIAQRIVDRESLNES